MTQEILPPQRAKKSNYKIPEDETIHKLWIVNPKVATQDIVERDCRIVVTDKVTWAEPLMPLKGSAKDQKRFMLGAFAFYTRKQAERKKLIQLIALSKLGHLHQIRNGAHEAIQQLNFYKQTGIVK